MPPSRISAWTGGSPSAHTPSSSARRNSGRCDSRTRSPRWWSNVGYRKKRSCSSAKCLSGSRMPPLRRVTSCSPSASARTVTAHSLNAIGIEREVGRESPYVPATFGAQTCASRAVALATTLPPEGPSHPKHTVFRSQNWPAKSHSHSNDRMIERPRSEFQPREPFDRLEHACEVAVREPAAHRRALGLVGRRRGRDRPAGRQARLERQSDVLDHVLELEQRREVVGEHRLGLQ